MLASYSHSTMLHQAVFRVQCTGLCIETHLVIQIVRTHYIFRDSSTVEQLAVNELVPGSNPGRGAERKHTLSRCVFVYSSATESNTKLLSSGFEDLVRNFWRHEQKYPQGVLKL